MIQSRQNAIVTTTINSATEALQRFSKMKDWQLIVALDENSKAFELADTVTLTIGQQEKMSPQLHQILGSKNIQRRNFATLYALRQGYDRIAFVDDDNIPLHNWEEIASTEIFNQVKVFETESIIWDPLQVIDPTKELGVVHRGFPTDLERIPSNLVGEKSLRPDVVAMLWNGDWDVNAVDRQKHSCSGQLNLNYVITSKTPAPFNSQNTVMNRSAAENFFMFPGIGRFDDILASFYLQCKGFTKVYTPPTVEQKRNTHNNDSDIALEVWGHKNIVQIIRELKSGKEVGEIGILPDQTRTAFDVWMKEIEKLR